MLISKYLMAVVAVAASFAVSSVASANDQDVRATTIPASACRPRNDVADAAVTLSNGAYVFNGSATGTVILYCPLPINAHTISDTTDDNDISTYRVYYRDSDGIGSEAEIRTRLNYRDSSGLQGVGTTWSSNESNTTTNTIRYVSLNHDVGFNRLYFFTVIMQRTNTGQDPAFSGIDFALPPVP
ncbi:MAG: hypothetical protein SAK29_01825 [Scytonema sp. PMC 1069.18]|nr:hypothetical protein [Scytonema sp. PMC 1069.18]MEC4882293.1 hypothetical protein [Scytonema sp. PMC 1070.18]